MKTILKQMEANQPFASIYPTITLDCLAGAQVVEDNGTHTKIITRSRPPRSNFHVPLVRHVDIVSLHIEGLLVPKDITWRALTFSLRVGDPKQATNIPGVPP